MRVIFIKINDKSESVLTQIIQVNSCLKNIDLIAKIDDKRLLETFSLKGFDINNFDKLKLMIENKSYELNSNNIESQILNQLNIHNKNHINKIEDAKHDVNLKNNLHKDEIINSIKFILLFSI